MPSAHIRLGSSHLGNPQQSSPTSDGNKWHAAGRDLSDPAVILIILLEGLGALHSSM